VAEVRAKSLHVRLPAAWQRRHYEREDEFVECKAVKYAQLFPSDENKAVAFLRDHYGS